MLYKFDFLFQVDIAYIYAWAIYMHITEMMYIGLFQTYKQLIDSSLFSLLFTIQHDWNRANFNAVKSQNL